MSEGPHDGRDDVAAAVARLASKLPEPLRPLAPAAYNYAWAWTLDGRAVLHDLAPHRWALVNGNPVRQLEELTEAERDRALADPALLDRIAALAADLDRALTAPRAADHGLPGPVAFLCSEFGVHGSLPVYSGGLGVLAGDVLKEASDRGLPYVGIGLLYRFGYFHQRLDLAGDQQEYWTELDPEHHPVVRVTGESGAPLSFVLHLDGRDVAVAVWRADVGRVPLFLLDTYLEENHPVDRWITARLYEANRAVRLAQYGLLGMGSVRLLGLLGIEPAVLHLNEGHAALATLGLAAEHVAAGSPFAEALEQARRRVVFTTHTPVPAGNEQYGAEEWSAAWPRLPEILGITRDELLDLGRTEPGDPDDPVSLTPLAIRSARSVNAVSRRHGEVAREMWRPMFPERAVEGVPITHVTNGIHVPTFMAPPMRRLLDRALGPGWLDRVTEPATWDGLDEVSDAELWSVRCELRAGLIERARRRSVRDRLLRGEQIEYVEAAFEALDADTLTVGFARRIATYKRLHLLGADPARAVALLSGDRPLQILFAGKAHPADDRAKTVVRNLFELKHDPRVAERAVFLEDYDLSTATWLVAGCDVWVNLPRPPNEASGTSGMKAATNGVLNLSVLDGWWAEAYDGTNGWAIPGEVDPDQLGQDERHAGVLYDLLEHEVVPAFYERDPDGVPRRWTTLMRASLRSLVPQYSATRMLRDYVHHVYPTR